MTYILLRLSLYKQVTNPYLNDPFWCIYIGKTFDIIHHFSYNPKGSFREQWKHEHIHRLTRIFVKRHSCRWSDTLQGNAQTPSHVVNAHHNTTKAQGQKTVTSDHKTKSSGEANHKWSECRSRRTSRRERQQLAQEAKSTGQGLRHPEKRRRINGNELNDSSRCTRFRENEHFLHFKPAQECKVICISENIHTREAIERTLKTRNEKTEGKY